MLRELDLKTHTVKTIAGTGKQDRERADGGPALQRGLNSPWDLLSGRRSTFHRHGGAPPDLDADSLKTKQVEPFAGNGRENIKDGPRVGSQFCSAQRIGQRMGRTSSLRIPK